MNVPAKLVQGGKALDQLIGEVLGMGGGKSDPGQPFDVVHHFQQFGKAAVAFLGAVTVHVLTQECHLPDTVSDQGADL